MISIKSLNKFFNKGSQNEIHVINNASLELPEKGMVAIFGKSGCGKTTLLNVIGGLDEFQSGSLTVDGQDIRRDTDTVRNKLIGYIFQNYNLNKAETCFDNVADALRLCGMTDKEEIRTRTMAALANVNMEHYHARTPDTLSGGQQQRIAIARAIVKNPRIILADEPTGNLDEANTILIMDLLKEISRDHLVLLVTHEANLVDYYCDTVIELQDGKIIGTRSNTGANGFSARNKNDIFLGELEHTELSGANAEIEYFGARPETPVRLRIVNNGGKLYIQVRTPKVQVLDESSEVRLREGVYEHTLSVQEQKANIDMSKLPPVQGTKFGKLFSFSSSVKSGYNANFHRRKKGKKVLQTCMALFSAILVLMTSLFGTAFKKLIDADKAYNHNVFYVYTPDGSVSDRLNEALSADTGIDSLRLTRRYPSGDDQVGFMTGYFESFTVSPSMRSISTNAVLLENGAAKDLPLAAGQKTGLSENDLLITTAVADALLEKSTLGYIRTYQDLIGLITTDISANNKNMRIAGVVTSSETAVYLPERSLSNYVHSQMRDIAVKPASDYGITLANGETVFLYSELPQGMKAPKGTVKIHGMEFNIKQIKKLTRNYEDWLYANGYPTPDFNKWAQEQIRAEHPELTEGSPEYDSELSRLNNERAYEFALEQYYSRIDEFLTELGGSLPINELGTELWMYCNKQVTDVKYTYMENGERLYQAAKYKELNGRYPTEEELMAGISDLPSLKQEIERYYMRYDEEYQQQMWSSSEYFEGRLYLVSDADYTALSKRIGETHDTASRRSEKIYEDFMVSADYSPSYGMVSDMTYTVIHTSDPAKTVAYLEREFSDLSTGYENLAAVVTPHSIYDGLIQDQRRDIFSNLISMLIILGLMSVCMYFIMRSSLMNRIKEIGIYRAIGVSRKNLIFRFFIESLVLTTLTVFVGFLFSAVVIRAWLGLSPLMSSLFFFPLWLAGILLAILYAICLFCGTVPILTLLRKTPSEILAKYDI